MGVIKSPLCLFFNIKNVYKNIVVIGIFHISPIVSEYKKITNFLYTATWTCLLNVM